MSTKKRNQPTVWHYTYDHIVDILDSGVLLPPRMTPHFNQRDSSILLLGESIKKHKGFQADSKLLLFSQRADWEPASFRGCVIAGQVIDLLKLEDYEAVGMRVYRIGVSRDLLHPWMRLKSLCGMPSDMARASEKLAREIGSNPYDWWGTMRPIPQDKWRSVETYNPATKASEALTVVPEVEQEEAPPAQGSAVVFDEHGNLVAKRSSPAASPSSSLSSAATLDAEREY